MESKGGEGKETEKGGERKKKEKVKQMIDKKLSPL